MPVPTEATYSAAAQLAALVGAHTSLRDLLDAGAGPAELRFRRADDVLLGTVLLSDPCGTVNAGTGVLTITPAGDSTWVAAGEVAYGELCDSTGAVVLALPAQEGEVAVAGRAVLNTVAASIGGAVVVSSIQIG